MNVDRATKLCYCVKCVFYSGLQRRLAFQLPFVNHFSGSGQSAALFHAATNVFPTTCFSFLCCVYTFKLQMGGIRCIFHRIDVKVPAMGWSQRLLRRLWRRW